MDLLISNTIDGDLHTLSEISHKAHTKEFAKNTISLSKGTMFHLQ